MPVQLIALYGGPDQLIPVVSILATVIGFLLLFWNRVIGALRRLLGRSKLPVEGSTGSAEADRPLGSSSGRTDRE